MPPEWWEWGFHREFLKDIRKALEAGKEKNWDEKSQKSLCLLAGNVRNVLEERKKREVPLDLWDDLSAIAKRCKAVHEYETALNLCKLLYTIKENAKPERVELLLDMGSIHQHWGNYGKARKFYEQALNATREDDNWRGSCYKSLGVACRKLGYYEEAEEYFKKALHCYKRKDLIVLDKLGIITAPDAPGVVTAQEVPGVTAPLDDLDRDVITAQHDLGHVYRHLGEKQGLLFKSEENR